ncbi:MAG: hypothetical protein H8E98_06985 [Bacteroidetes bacterium]|nr:hypothetical protein [Bacteroidota bacterium]
MKYYLLIALMFASVVSFAQYESVQYNYEKNWFNESRPLPAESDWMLTGAVSKQTKLVEVSIYLTSDIKKDDVYVADWKIPFDKTSSNFSIPINYKLRGNERYSFTISYFRNCEINEKITLQKTLIDIIGTYISQILLVDNNQIYLSKSPKTARNELDKIVIEGLTYYRSKSSSEFEGFSDLVLDKLNYINKLKLKNARLRIIKNRDDENSNIKVKFIDKQLYELKVLCAKELSQYLSHDMYVLFDKRVVLDYLTTKVKNVIPINLGYLGVYNSGSISSLSYGSAPYAGISFPLGKSAFSNAFWSNTSLSAGVILNNFKFSENKTTTGPLIGLPSYIGIGYKTFYLLRLNAGIVFLQNEVQSQSNLNFSNIYVRPYIGLSLEFNLWIGIN